MVKDGKCMVCGCVTAEGRHICLTCERGNDMQQFGKIRTNADMIRNMDEYDLCIVARAWICQKLREGKRSSQRCTDFGNDCDKCVLSWLRDKRTERR